MANDPFIYDQYCENLKKKQGKYPKNIQLYKHRIIPGHEGGTYTNQNVVFISFEEHKLAHFYRYLSYQKKADITAYRFMSGQTEEARLLLASHAGKIGGKISSDKNKKNKVRFFDPTWQKEFGDKSGGQRNIDSGHLERLNKKIDENDPELKSRAGKLGGKTRITKQRANQTNLFNPTASMQKKGNLVRWGVKINGKRIPFGKLSSDFIDYYLKFADPKNFK